MNIDIGALLLVHNHGELHGIPYQWGSKPIGKRDTANIRNSDCSGWTQYLLWRQGIEIPEGSVEQREWLQRNYPGAPLVPLRVAAKDANPGSLYWCFIPPVLGGHAGHTFFLHRGETIECCGGRGVCSRPWWTRVLLMETQWCFKVAG